MPGANVNRTARWDRYWYGEGSLVRLAVFRIVMLLACLYAVHRARFGVLRPTSGEELRYLTRDWNPIYLFELLRIGPMRPGVAPLVYAVLLGTIGLGLVGWFTRTACALAAILSLYWIGIHYSFGQPHHEAIALSFGLLALPFAPVGARLSLDSLLARRRAPSPLGAPTRAPMALFPLRVTQISIVLGYTFAGWTKLVSSGPGWMNGYTLMAHMLQFDAPWTKAFSGSARMCQLMSIGLISIQGTFFLVLWFPKLRWFYIPGSVVFHLVAWKTMDTGTFIPLWFTLSAFIEWERVPDLLERARKGSSRLRLGAGLVAVALPLAVAAIYSTLFPTWIVACVLPPSLMALLRLRSDTPVHVRYDPNAPDQRQRIATLAALDWSAQLQFAAVPGMPGPVQAEGGREATPLSLAARLPLLLPIAPLVKMLTARGR